jgi:hypothetical protein
LPNALAVLALALPAAGADAVTIVFEYDREPSPAVHHHIEQEVAAVMPVRVEWRQLDASIAGEAFSKIVVTHFRGTCRAVPATPAPKTRVLGRTHVSCGQIQPFTEVDCDLVRAYLGPVPEGKLGRALGRLVAHELYHVLAGTVKHARAGISRAWLTPAELLRPKLWFGRSETDAIRKGSGVVPEPTLAAQPHGITEGGQD